MFKYIQQRPRDMLPIVCKNLGLVAGEKNIISDLSITITSPGITVIMGPNGSGKSVFINLLHGLIIPSKGVIHFKNRPIDKQIRRRQAMVFQSPTILRRSVISNMMFVDSIESPLGIERCYKILKMLDLEELSEKPAKLLSSGEKQRLALARAIVLRPEILFLDEPTANLDPMSIAKIEEIVKNASLSGVKIIFITHDIGQAKRLSDDIVFIHKGKLAEYTKKDIFFKSPKSREANSYLEGRIVI